MDNNILDDGWTPAYLLDAELALTPKHPEYGSSGLSREGTIERFRAVSDIYDIYIYGVEAPYERVDHDASGPVDVGSFYFFTTKFDGEIIRLGSTENKTLVDGLYVKKDPRTIRNEMIAAAEKKAKILTTEMERYYAAEDEECEEVLAPAYG